MPLTKVDNGSYIKYGNNVQSAKGYTKNADGIIVNVAGGERTKYVICPKTDKTISSEKECKQYAMKNLSLGAKANTVDAIIGSGELFEF